MVNNSYVSTHDPYHQFYDVRSKTRGKIIIQKRLRYAGGMLDKNITPMKSYLIRTNSVVGAIRVRRVICKNLSNTRTQRKPISISYHYCRFEWYYKNPYDIRKKSFLEKYQNLHTQSNALGQIDLTD